MAIAFVQSVIASSGAASATTAGITTTSGNFVVGVLGANSGVAGNSITDNYSNTWTIAESRFSGNNFCKIIYAKNITGGAGHTFTGVSDASVVIAIHEYSGIDTVSPLDKTASATSGLDSGATATTAQADELIVGGVTNGTTAVTVGTGYSNFLTAAPGGQVDGAIESKIVAATGTYNATFGGTPDITLTLVATFKGVASATTGASFLLNMV